MALNIDEFRLLAFLRGYADGWGDRHHLDPGWVAEKLEFEAPRMLQTARRLAELDLVTIFEFQEAVDPSGSPTLTDITLTERGWNYLVERAAAD